MRKLGTLFLAVILVFGGALAVFWPSNFYRLFDANLRPLALTEQEAYCVGLLGLPSNFTEDDPDVKACRVSEAGKGVVPSIGNTPGWFCHGMVAAEFQGSVRECVDILEMYDLWPLLEGGLTAEWTAAWPRPALPVQTFIGNERSGSRITESRDTAE